MSYLGKYEYTDDMGEISGFGGDYEAACKAMVLAGLEWLDSHPNADPVFHGIKNVFGLIMEDNDDAKSLTEAMAKVPELKGDGPTGAMMQAAVGHAMFIKVNGWAKYSQEMRARDKDV